MRPNAICPICMSYMLHFTSENHKEYLRCGCGYHSEIIKRIIEPIRQPEHQEEADKYYRKKKT